MPATECALSTRHPAQFASSDCVASGVQLLVLA